MLAKVFVAFKKQTAKRRGSGNGWETKGKHIEKSLFARDLELVKHKKKKKKKRCIYKCPMPQEVYCLLAAMDKGHIGKAGRFGT